LAPRIALPAPLLLAKRPADREHVAGRLDVREERPAVAGERRPRELRVVEVVAGEDVDVALVGGADEVLD
jgi:hypothetical protein